MSENIEDTIFDDGMAVNCIAGANRLIELLHENNTNCLKDLKDPRIKRLMWFLNQYVFGQTATIDMYTEWDRLYKEWKQGCAKNV